jgi:hypothetical protein
MCLITLNNITGVPPYTVEVCDYFKVNCQTIAYYDSYIPPQLVLSVPAPYNTAPVVVVRVYDANGCISESSLSMFTPTPTNTNTPTVTPTPTITPTNQTPTPTPTNTPTPSITSTKTPTPTITPTALTPTPTSTPTPTPQTPTPTPTNTPTVTITPTVTKTKTPTTTNTPSVTPSLSPLPPTKAFLFIEPQSGSTDIGQWMYDNSQTFYGFTNSTAPALNQNKFNQQLNIYVDFSGWTSGLFPSIINQDVPQTTGGNDSFGNAIVAYNFKTTKVDKNTVSGKAWYTWMIPTGMTNGLYQTKIDYSTSSPSMPPTTVNTEPKIYSYYFTYSGTTIPQTTYRVYTTYPSTNFNLLNTSDIYFKGNTVS